MTLYYYDFYNSVIEAESELSLKHGSSKDEANEESNKQVIISKTQMDKCKICKRFAIILINVLKNFFFFFLRV